MCLDKRRWIQPAACVCAIAWPNERRDEFAHFKMQMREITAAAGSYRCDLLAAPNIVARVHQHCLHVAVIRLHVLAFAIDWLANPCGLCRCRSAPASSIFDIGVQ